MLEVASRPPTGAPEADAHSDSRRLLGAAHLAGLTTVTLAVAVLVAVSARQEGAYYVDVWAPLGLALVAGLGVLLFLGRRPSLLATVGAAGLVAVGGWSVLSTQWGGLPNDAWTMLDQSVVGGAALLVSSALAVDARFRTAVYAGVCLGLTANAAEILVRVGTGHSPGGWFFERFLEGPVGYHNAQATLFVLGLPLSLMAAVGSRFYVRAAGGAATGSLLGALILTQSRGALLAAGIGVVVLLALARDLRLLLFSTSVLIATAALLFAFRDVDAALVAGPAASHVGELRRYVLWSGVAALVLAVAAAVNARTRAGLVAAGAVASVALVLGVAGGVHSSATIGRAFHRLASSTGASSDPDTAPAGATRLASLSLNGRRQAWGVGWRMARQRPLVGAGQGQFSRRWGTDRRVSSLYILQPHSLELELLSELGAVGVGAFLVFVVAALLCAARAPSRRHGAIALAMIVALLGEVSVDWTWSFPGVVVPVLLVVGTASNATRFRRLRLWAVVAVVPAFVIVTVLLAGPYLSDRQLDRGRALARTNPDEAWTLAQDAQRLNPWDWRVFDFEGKLAEASGRYRLAARKYDRSAALARQPWVGYFREAGALAKAGANARRKGACRRAFAANPSELILREGPCKGLA